MAKLRQRFLKFILAYWKLDCSASYHKSCVYIIVGIDPLTRESDIYYVGSTTNMFLRYKSHSIPSRIEELNLVPALVYLPMNKGFYDYEMKLIKKLNPLFNKQHKQWH